MMPSASCRITCFYPDIWGVWLAPIPDTPNGIREGMMEYFLHRAGLDSSIMCKFDKFSRLMTYADAP